jgi:hypothetical protein
MTKGNETRALADKDRCATDEQRGAGRNERGLASKPGHAAYDEGRVSCRKRGADEIE